MIFDDRHDAGRRLVPALRHLGKEQPLVLAVPRGGLPVAGEVARGLSLPLGMITVRKLGAPQNPEMAIGAIAEGGTAVLDESFVRRLGVSEETLAGIVEREQRELDRRVSRFRAERERLEVMGRTVIIVDDGLATGLTDLAAVRAVRELGASRIVVAVPVGSHEGVAMLEREADEVVCLHVPTELYGVGAWYRDFSPVADDEVLSELAEAGAPDAAPAETDSVREVGIPVGRFSLTGDLRIPPDAVGLVIFAHGSGSSRLSTRNLHVAEVLQRRGLATLLFDLLTPEESASRACVFDIPLLTRRLTTATLWASAQPRLRDLPTGLFGASTGAAAALCTAADLGAAIGAVVSRGGRPDLASDHLSLVTAPTLLIVGGRDEQVLRLNQDAASHLRCPHAVAVVPEATHLFEEPGALDEVAVLAGDWFLKHLGHPRTGRRGAGATLRRVLAGD